MFFTYRFCYGPWYQHGGIFTIIGRLHTFHSRYVILVLRFILSRIRNGIIRLLIFRNRTITVDPFYAVTFVFRSIRRSYPMINIISQVVAVRISSVFFRKNNCMIVIFQRIIFTLSNLKMRCFVRISQCSSCYFIEIKSILINLIIPQISMSLDYIILYVFINFSRPLLIKTDKIFRC